MHIMITLKNMNSQIRYQVLFMIYKGTCRNGKWNGISNFLGNMTGGNGGNMFSNFFSNLFSGNVSGMSMLGLVASAFLIFGRFGWMGKIAGALLGMMMIGNNTQRQQEASASVCEQLAELLQ